MTWQRQEGSALPTLFSIGKYRIFFWSNENAEPIHIHICLGDPTNSSTKIWLTSNGGFVVAHNEGRIPKRELNDILKVLPVHFFYICSEWKRFFGVDKITFYC